MSNEGRLPPHRPLPVKLSTELGSLKPQSVKPDIFDYARARGIAADTVQAPPYLDVNLEFPLEHGGSDIIKCTYQKRLAIFRDKIKPKKLEMPQEVKLELAINALDDLLQAEPEWNTIFPEIPSYNAPEPQPYLLTYAGELAGKVLLAKKLHGAEVASKLSPEDSPLEIDRQHLPPALQAMIDPTMKKDTSTKLECSKESLALAAESQAEVLPGKAFDTMLEVILPKLHERSIESSDTLCPIDESVASSGSQKARNEDSMLSPKRKHAESGELSPVERSPQPAHRLSISRSVSVAVSDRVSSSPLPVDGTPTKKLKTAKSMPHFSRSGHAIEVDDSPLSVLPGNKRSSNKKEITLLAGSMNLSNSPNSVPTDATLIPVNGTSGAPFIDSASSETSLAHDDMPDNSKKALVSDKSKDREPPFNLTSSQLGSLMHFMEARGASQVGGPFAEESPKTKEDTFAEESLRAKEEEEFLASYPLPLEWNINAFDGTCPTVDSQSDIPAPDVPTAHLVLFLSTMLLQTHLSLIKSLHDLPSPPKLIFRDYAPAVNHLRDDHAIPDDLSTGPLGRPLHLPEEADLIVAPNTGVILTNIQALTQLYLPGHEQKNPRALVAGKYRGPVYTRIKEISSRYEHLYVLVCDSGTKKLDKPTKEAIQYLLVVSYDLRNCSKVTPLFVKSSEEVAKTIISLSHKHTSEVSSSQSRNLTPASKSRIVMTPPGAKKATPPIYLLIKDPETRWELFLRCLGLNPFAARLVLGILEAREQDEIADSKAPAENKSSALCTFIAMDMEEMMDEFGQLVGNGIVEIVQYQTCLEYRSSENAGTE